MVYGLYLMKCFLNRFTKIKIQNKFCLFLSIFLFIGTLVHPHFSASALCCALVLQFLMHKRNFKLVISNKRINTDWLFLIYQGLIWCKQYVTRERFVAFQFKCFQLSRLLLSQLCNVQQD